MSLRIRMSRGGAKKRPYYRIVVADSRKPRDGRFIEKIGFFDPMRAKDASDRSHIDAERAKYWLGVGAQPSDRVQTLLSAIGLCEAPKRHEQTQQHLPKQKAQERAQERADKAATAAEAAKEAAKAQTEAPAAEEATSEEPPVEETPAEDTPTEDTITEAPEEKPAEDTPTEDTITEAPEEKPAE